MKPHRRNLMLGMASVLASTTLPPSFGQAASGDADAIARDIVATAARLREAHPVGRAYLTSYLDAEVRTQADLTGVLVQTLQQATGPADGSLHQRLAKLVAQDFAEQRICFIEGWHLSATECRLAGLAVLASGDAAGKRLEARRDSPASRLDALQVAQFVTVQNWGPRSTTRGVPFAVQPDGHSALWFQVDKPPPLLAVFVGGIRVSISSGLNVITAAIYGRDYEQLVSTAGRHEVVFVDLINNKKQTVGFFQVEQRPDAATLRDGTSSRVFCRPAGWGPRETSIGKPVNIQPDGSSAFWVQIGCAPPAAKLVVGGRTLETTFHNGVVTAALKDVSAFAAPGQLPVVLVDPKSKEEVAVGEFVITP
jgi:hypothetical protein